ncbi:alpha-ketoglutarate-dependent dioxygenase AlkB [Streptomyces stelliscabiei]|uniref:alpha-ketoglutarate-dependent dioxygenase AlkB n=1 Tax=Streptomyces stelliscabiei TaxID=146820 RepID=UPI003A958173
MATHLQGSLFDQSDDLRLGPLDGLRRRELGAGAWIDLLPGWLTGADALFTRLAEEVPWKAERRQMYEQVVDVPRLLAYYRRPRNALPDPVLDEAPGGTVRAHGSELGENVSPRRGCASTRDGGTALAWHGDRIRAGRPGGTRWWPSCPWANPRDLALRTARRRASETLRFPQGHGD